MLQKEVVSQTSLLRPIMAGIYILLGIVLGIVLGGLKHQYPTNQNPPTVTTNQMVPPAFAQSAPGPMLEPTTEDAGRTKPAPATVDYEKHVDNVIRLSELNRKMTDELIARIDIETDVAKRERWHTMLHSALAAIRGLITFQNEITLTPHGFVNPAPVPSSGGHRGLHNAHPQALPDSTESYRY